MSLSTTERAAFAVTTVSAANKLKAGRAWAALVIRHGSARAVDRHLKTLLPAMQAASPHDTITAPSHKTISQYVETLAALPKDVDAATFADALTTRQRKDRNAGKADAPKDAPKDAEPKDAEPVTRGNSKPVTTLKDALAALDTLTTLAATFSDDERETFTDALLTAAESLTLAVTVAA